jgi:predicted restriction endonuclease
MTKLCAFCGKPIPPDRTSPNVKYCSTACARKADSQKRREYIIRRNSNLSKIRWSIYTAYNQQCALCGWKVGNTLWDNRSRYIESGGNEIHHIVPAREGGKETFDNLILLCPNHHKQADLGYISREELRRHTISEERAKELERERARHNTCAEAICKAIEEARP